MGSSQSIAEHFNAETVTREAAQQCQEMTKKLSAAIDDRAAKQAEYARLDAEYQRRAGLRAASETEYIKYCSGACVNGGAQEHKCNAMCRNWAAMNPPLVRPTPPVFPDLGNYVCSICAQSVDVSAIAGRDFNMARNAVNQQMQCSANILADHDAKDAAARDAATREQAAKDAAARDAATAHDADAQRAPSDTTNATDAASARRRKIAIVLIVATVLLVIVAIVIAIIVSQSSSSRTGRGIDREIRAAMRDGGAWYEEDEDARADADYASD